MNPDLGNEVFKSRKYLILSEFRPPIPLRDLVG